MTENSEASYIDSENDSDYLMKGLNWRNKGDISHLPKATQKTIKIQRAKAKEQGAFKYIGPLKGQKVPIYVDQTRWEDNERKP